MSRRLYRNFILHTASRLSHSEKLKNCGKFFKIQIHHIMYSISQVPRAVRPIIRGGRVFQTTRNIYIHKGSRMAGMKRDEEEVFTNSDGLKYDNSSDNVKHIQEYLPAEYAISDDLAMQVITHKSFVNGIKPYNEKLSAMGSKLMNLYFAKWVISKPSTNDLAINGQNLDILGLPIAKELSGRMAAGIFAKTTKLNSIMFWNSYSQGLSFETSGELKVSAQMVYALVGAVAFTHGKAQAEKFIEEKIVSSNEAIARKIVEGDRE